MSEQSEPSESTSGLTELEFCARWAAVWSGLACYARSIGRFELAEKFTDAADDVFEALEWREERAGKRAPRKLQNITR